MNKPFTDSDLPRQHLGTEGHYIPPKTRVQTERERLHALPAGTLLLERQKRGIEIARLMLTNAVAPQDQVFTTKVLAMSAINTSWYAFAQNAPDVMRRRLKLPKLADHQTDWRQTADGLRTETLRGLEIAEDMAGIQLYNHINNNLRFSKGTVAGRRLGNASLQLAAMHHNATYLGGDAVDIQKAVRDMALENLEESKEFGKEIGAHPSVAQLSDPFSPLALYIRSEAPDTVLETYEQANAY